MNFWHHKIETAIIANELETRIIKVGCFCPFDTLVRFRMVYIGLNWTQSWKSWSETFETVQIRSTTIKTNEIEPIGSSNLNTGNRFEPFKGRTRLTSGPSFGNRVPSGPSRQPLHSSKKPAKPYVIRHPVSPSGPSLDFSAPSGPSSSGPSQRARRNYEDSLSGVLHTGHCDLPSRHQKIPVAMFFWFPIQI